MGAIRAGAGKGALSGIRATSDAGTGNETELVPGEHERARARGGAGLEGGKRDCGERVEELEVPSVDGTALVPAAVGRDPGVQSIVGEACADREAASASAGWETANKRKSLITNIS